MTIQRETLTHSQITPPTKKILCRAFFRTTTHNKTFQRKKLVCFFAIFVEILAFYIHIATMKRIFIATCLVLATANAAAQKTMTYTTPTKTYSSGRDMYDLMQFNTSFSYMGMYLNNPQKTIRNQYYADAQYYLASSAYEMNRKDALKRLENFSAECPYSPHINRVNFMKGVIYFNQSKFNEANSEGFEKCDVNRLSKEEQAEYYFYHGYCQLQMGNTATAYVEMKKLKDMNSRYNLPGQYYTAYIDYVEERYDEALPVFLSLQERSEYAKVVPYYIAQIYYKKGQTDKVLEYGLQIVDKYPDNSNNAEIYRLIGESYFEKKDYDKCIKYLSLYEQKVSKVYRNDMYMLGVSYYQKGKYSDAADRLKKVTVVTDDTMAQNAYLYLGTCDIKLDDKNAARLAFGSAANLEHDKRVQEEAMYNYALLVYEQSYSPFNESVTAFERFLETFPKSKYKESVYNYLLNVYLTTKNYQAAYESIQKIKDPSASILGARQRILYCLGIQDFTDDKMQTAIDWFSKSLEDRVHNTQTEALALFWRGEAYYRTGQTTKASADFNSFVNCVGARTCGMYNTGLYDLGYCHFSSKNYPEALTWFRKYVNLETSNKTLIADANNRIGDCYYNARDFDNAQKAYAKVYSQNGPGADYACFQKGFIQGLQKDYNGKISTLNKLLTSYPQSEYQADAMYEIGRSYVLLGQYEKAISSYDKLNRTFFHNPLARKGRLQTAMLYDEMNRYDEAVKVYKQIVDLFPNSVEAKTSLDGLKQIYFEKNDVQAYADYVESLGGITSFSATEQDSLTYLAAEKIYFKGEFQSAVTSFASYIEKYPNGVFINNARYNLAVSYQKLDNNEKAKEQLKIVAEAKGTWQAENALVRLSKIQYDEKDYTEALKSYEHLLKIGQKAENTLKARTGIMRCHNNLGNNDSTIAAASKLIADSKLDPALTREAYYLRAKGYEKNNELKLAFDDYKYLSDNCMDAYGAEAEYLVAEYLNHNGDAAGAEKEIFAFIEKNTPHQYWLAKAFILLSDIYIAQGKDFEAKQYLLSLKENYKSENDNIDTEIKARLDEISAREANQVKQ